MFEKASRKKIRFSTSKGLATVEDLWDLPLLSDNGDCLDNIARALSKEIKEVGEESFVLAAVEAKTANMRRLDLSFKIVKHIIAVRLEEAKQRETARDRKEQKEKIMAIIAAKQDNALEATSLEDLQKMLAEL
jgi:hypothetical protein